MKTTINILSALTILSLTCCVDLNTSPEGNYVTDEQKKEASLYKPSIASAAVNSLFSQMKMYQPNVKSIGERFNDFGYPSVMLMMEFNGCDVVGRNNSYNYFYKNIDFSDRDNTTTQSQIVWGTLYKQIYTANALIGALPERPVDATGKGYLAQGLAIRGFNYWVLAQLYQHTFVGHEQLPCVPLITEKNANDVATQGCPRATVNEVYTQILSDLDRAVTLLEESGLTVSDKRYINKWVAYGLRARVHLTMQHWNEAIADADKAIESFAGRPYLPNELNKPGFWNSNDVSWMWAIVIDETDDVVLKGNPEKGICNFTSHIGSLNFGFTNYNGGCQINKSLFATIPKTDIRKSWWLDENGQTTSYNGVLSDIMKQAGYKPFTNVKFGPYNDELNTRVNANDVPLMRVEEMYFIKTEALAMTNQIEMARILLTQFMNTCRDQKYVCNASNAAELQEEIYRQRRIEFWGEGLSWFDLMRLNKGLDRTDAGYPDSSSAISISAGSERLLWTIPQTEIESNPRL